MKRVPLWRVLPVLFLVAFYWQGLDTWFYQDDFGWLNVRREIHGWAGLLPALFVPKAHGNIRPLSETGFFTLFSALFGVDALPFRIWVFLTQAAALVLLGSVVRRLTGSRAAAFWAQVFWAVNCGLAVVMCWTSIYNQALCGFFLLLAFRCLLGEIETGRRGWRIAHWAAFLAGFGALEINVVYPVLAALYTRFAARKHVRATLPMLAVSVVYAAVHFAAAPGAAEGVYALHPGLSMAGTFWTYWAMALGPERLAAIRPLAPWLVAGATALLSAAALAAAVRVPGAWFGLAWFAVTLAPYLPMRDHVMDYYLAVPAIGLGMAGGCGVAWAWRRGWRGRTAAVVAAAVYLGFSLPASQAVVRWHHDRSRAVENLVTGVAEIHRGSPGTIILLTGISTDLFYAGMVDVPFRVLEIPRVYLTPEAAAGIRAPAALVGKFVLPEALAVRELDAGRAVVYDDSSGVLRNVTRHYRQSAPAAPATPRFLNVGDPLFAEYLGAGWGPAQEGKRRMSGEASLRIGTPAGLRDRLWLGIYSAPAAPPRVYAGGIELRPEGTAAYPGWTDFGFVLPRDLAGRGEMEVRIESPAALTFGFAEVRAPEPVSAGSAGRP